MSNPDNDLRTSPDAPRFVQTPTVANVNGEQQIQEAFQKAEQAPVGGGNSAIDAIKNIVFSITNNDGKVVNAQALGDAEKRQIKAKASSFTTQIEKVIATIKSGRTADVATQCKLPEVTVNLLRKIDAGDINQNNSAIIYSVLKHTYNTSNTTVTTDILRDLAVEVYRMRFIDGSVAAKVLEAVVKKMKDLGYDTENDLTILSIESYYQGNFNSIKNRQARGLAHGYGASVQSLINPDGVGMDGIVNRNKVREIFKTNNNGRDPSAAELDAEVDSYKTQLVQGYNAMQSDNANQNAHLDWQRIQQEMLAAGIITQGAVDLLQQRIVQLGDLRLKFDQDYMDTSMLEQEMVKAGVRLTGKHKNMLLALDNGEVFAKYLREEGYYEQNGNLKWDRVLMDVGQIFDGILSVVDGHVNDEFSHAFNQMYEGHFYDILLRRIEYVSHDLAKIDEVKKQPVTLEQTDWYRDDTYKKLGTYQQGPRTALARKTFTTQSLAEAVGDKLYKEMANKKHHKEFLHNSEMITRKGLGWEQAKNYSVMMKMDDVDRMFAEDKLLSDAYQFYMQEMQNDFGLNYHIVGNEWGYEEKDGLDPTQRRAMRQMMAKYTKNDGEEYEDYKKRMRGKVLMASGLSKGVTGEFWGILLTARTPVLWEEYKLKDAGGRERTAYRVKQTFISGHHVGYEKMIGALDPDLLMERFNLPNQLKIFRWISVPVDYDASPEAYGQQMWLYEKENTFVLRDEVMSATVKGRSQWLIESDKHVRPIGEKLRQNAIDLMTRAGWRMVDYRNHMVYGSDRMIDFNASIENLRRLGPYAIKIFADDLADSGDLKSLKQTDVQRLIGVDKSGSDLTKDEIGKLKKKMYEQYIMKNIFDTTPSQLVCMETRRFSTLGEGFLTDKTFNYLNAIFAAKGYPPNIVSTHVHKLFQSALTCAERYVQTKKVRGGASMQYVFGDSDLDATDTAAAVWQFFQYYREDVGKIPLQSTDSRIPGSGNILDFGENINEAEFRSMLKGYLKEIRAHMALDYWDDEVKTTEANRLRQNHSPLSQSLLSDKLSLHQRYANMLLKGDGNMMYYVAGNNFDFNDFNLSGGGSRAAERMLSEVAGGAEKANHAIGSMGNAIVSFATAHVKDIAQSIDEVLEKTIFKPIEEVYKAYAGTIGEDAPAAIITRDLLVASMKAISVDPVSRVWGLGTWIKNWNWNINKGMSTLVADAIGESPGRVLNSLSNGDLIKHFVHAATNKFPTIKELHETTARYAPREKKKGPLSWLHLTSTKAEGEHASVHEEQLMKAVGESARSQIIETKLPILNIALIFAIFALMWLARKKNSGK